MKLSDAEKMWQNCNEVIFRNPATKYGGSMQLSDDVRDKFIRTQHQIIGVLLQEVSRLAKRHANMENPLTTQ